MKKILITGKKSYIGTCFSEWVSQWAEKYSVEFLSFRNQDWTKYDLSKYDILIHVAAIVHQKEKPENKDLYDSVNTRLTLDIAKKAKDSGVKQFIFMSSLSVYGLEGMIGQNVIITKDTPCIPNTFYGKSKLNAEEELKKLGDSNFIISIVRAPMIYGPNCPGNYKRLQKLVLKTLFFPQIQNKRSMIYIDCLSEFLRLLIDNYESGLFFPQNEEYVDTSELVKLIATEHSKSIYFSRILAFVIKTLGKNISILNKIFGNLVIDLNLSSYKDFKYCVVDFERSIKNCEIGKIDK